MGHTVGKDPVSLVIASTRLIRVKHTVDIYQDQRGRVLHGSTVRFGACHGHICLTSMSSPPASPEPETCRARSYSGWSRSTSPASLVRCQMVSTSAHWRWPDAQFRQGGSTLPKGEPRADEAAADMFASKVSGAEV